MDPNLELWQLTASVVRSSPGESLGLGITGNNAGGSGEGGVKGGWEGNRRGGYGLGRKPGSHAVPEPWIELHLTRMLISQLAEPTHSPLTATSFLFLATEESWLREKVRSILEPRPASSQLCGLHTWHI